MSRPAPASRLVGRQPLPFRMRPDLESRLVDAAAGQRVTVKDPVALRYHNLREDEWFLLSQLKEAVDLESLREAYQKRFAPQRVSLAQIQALLFRFHRSELVVSQSVGQSQTHTQRMEKRSREKWLGRLQSLLFIRFPGFDPEPLLRRLYPAVSWMLSVKMLSLMALFCLAALILFAAHADAYFAELPTLSQLAQPGELLLLALTLGATKICHELGHAIACKHYGGECHEIGPMLLVFTPALYCDTSDSWMLTNRMQRALVGAAGMIVECILAAAATFLWWYSQPGQIHSAAMNVMLVCSISTILFNGNPLLRYDGYYILSDLCDVPNLAQRSREHLKRTLGKWLLGIPVQPAMQPSARESFWLLVYQASATAYRWMITLAILWFITRFLRPYGLQSIGWTLCLLTVSSMVLIPAGRWVRTARIPGNLQKLRPSRVLFTGLLVASLCGLTFVPVTHHITGETMIVPRDATPVYVTMSGTRDLPTEVPPTVDGLGPSPGEIVQQGESLLSLKNTDLERQRAEAQRRLQSQRLLLEQLQRTQAFDPEAAAQIPFTQAALEDLRQRAEKLETRHRLLTITAPDTGILVRPRPTTAAGSRDQLSAWSDLPMASHNAGSFLETGVLLGSIATPGEYDAEIQITPEQIEYVRVGQPVTVMLAAFTDQQIEGKVLEVSEQEAQPAEQGRADLPTRYQVRIAIAPTALPLTYYQQGRAKILVGTHPLAQRIYRAIHSLFRFQ